MSLRTTPLLPSLLLAAALAWPGNASAAFLSVSDDIPLMTGLIEPADGALVFDTPAGRIAEVTASGPLSAQAVRAFYADTLPQLGWRKTGANAWAREGEGLRLEFPEQGAVRFVIAPEGAARPAK